MLQTIQKIGPLLDLFTVDHPEWGVTEAAEAIGMPRSSTHALMTSLVETGLLNSPGRGRYRLGWRIVELYETMRASLDLRAVGTSVLHALNEETGETVNMGVLDHEEVLYLDRVSGRMQLSVTGLRPGSRLEPHCCAIGKVLLAFTHPVEAQQILNARPLKRYTEHTITDPKKLVAELDEVRRTGLAYEDGEVVAEVACVAAPVRDPFGATVAAISLTVPAARMAKRKVELSKALRQAATEFTKRLAESQTTNVTLPLDDPRRLDG